MNSLRPCEMALPGHREPPPDFGTYFVLDNVPRRNGPRVSGWAATAEVALDPAIPSMERSQVLRSAGTLQVLARDEFV